MAILLAGGGTAHATGFGQNGTGGVTIDSSGANFTIFAAGWYAQITPDPSGFVDSKSNTYSNGTKQTTSTPISVRIYYSNNASPSVGVGHALTWTGANSFVTGSFSAWSGVNSGASVLDGENGKTGTGTSLTLDPITPSENNCLIVTMLCFEDNSAGTIGITGGGFAILDQVAWNGATNEGYAMAYVIQTTAAAVSPTWTVTSSAPTLAAVMAVFKGPGGGGGSGNLLMGQAMM